MWPEFGRRLARHHLGTSLPHIPAPRLQLSGTSGGVKLLISCFKASEKELLDLLHQLHDRRFCRDPKGMVLSGHKGLRHVKTALKLMGAIGFGSFMLG